MYGVPEAPLTLILANFDFDIDHTPLAIEYGAQPVSDRHKKTPSAHKRVGGLDANPIENQSYYTTN